MEQDENKLAKEDGGTEETIYEIASRENQEAIQEIRYGSSWEGILDEVRFSNTVRSAAWIKAEYNNQNDPSSFYSVGGEESL